jgi:hypothetical protein
MDRKLQIYVEGQRLDLFQDEKIVINSSIQNVNDISKVFTDLKNALDIEKNVYKRKKALKKTQNQEIADYEKKYNVSLSKPIAPAPVKPAKLSLSSNQKAEIIDSLKDLVN